MLKKIIESYKLRYRLRKYRNKNDPGGIEYITRNVKKGQTVMDIGAHKAAYLYCLYNLVGETGKVIAFEPQSKLFQYITSLKEMFGWKNVIIEHLALSDKKGIAKLFIPINRVKQGSSPGASIIDSKFTENCYTEMVQIETLDMYCSRNVIKPNFIKIDIEGNELNLFKGGAETLKKYKPKIIVEIETRHVGKEKVLETFEFMKSLNYAGQFIHGLNCVPINIFYFEKHQNLNDMKNYCNNFIFE